MLDQEEHKQLVYDIGPKQLGLYREILLQAETIFWNGPMGVWENQLLALGLISWLALLADAAATSIIGGGDGIAAIDAFGPGSAYPIFLLAAARHWNFSGMNSRPHCLDIDVIQPLTYP